MAGQTSEAALKIGGDASGAVAALKATASGLRETATAGGAAGKSIGVSFFKAQLAIEALKIGVRGFISLSKSTIGFAKETITLRQKEVIGIRTLDAALKHAGTSYDTNRRQIEGIATAIQKVTNFDDSAVRSMLEALVVGTGDFATAMKALPIAADLAAKGIGTDALIRAFRGQGRGLMALGIDEDVFKGGNVDQILAAIRKKIGGTAQAAADPWVQMANAVGDTKEALGALIQEPVEKFLKKITAALMDLNASGFFDKENILTNIKETLSVGGDLVGIWAKAWGGTILDEMKEAWTTVVQFMKNKMVDYWDWLKNNAPKIENLVQFAEKIPQTAEQKAQEAANVVQSILDMSYHGGGGVGGGGGMSSFYGGPPDLPTKSRKEIAQEQSEAAIENYLSAIGYRATPSEEPTTPKRFGQKPSWARGMTDEQFEVWRSAALKSPGITRSDQVAAIEAHWSKLSRQVDARRPAAGSLIEAATIWQQHTQGAAMPAQ